MIRIEELRGKGISRYCAVDEKDRYIGHVDWIRHPVCCGLGIIAGVSEEFEGLEECLEAAEEKSFVEERQAMAMITSNVEEEKEIKEVLVKRHWRFMVSAPNPIHANRLMTIWIKENPDPEEAEKIKFGSNPKGMKRSDGLPVL